MLWSNVLVYSTELYTVVLPPISNGSRTPGLLMTPATDSLAGVVQDAFNQCLLRCSELNITTSLVKKASLDCQHIVVAVPSGYTIPVLVSFWLQS